MLSPPLIPDDRWQLVERIGEGAMGEVWRGRHVLLGHEVAIKVMKPESATDRELITRFRREARIAAQLRHRNLVRVEDLGATTDGRPFLVMELLRGRSLASLLAAQRRPDQPLVARLVQHIGAACDIAHGAGIVHRDLKPDNCYVVTDEDGAPLVKVLDFGVAKVLDGMFVTSSGVVTASNALLGTPMYMSPEQARGQADLDGRSDLWSLAVIAYEMLTGRLPYNAPTLSQLLYAVLAEPIAPPSQLDPSLARLDGWFARALARDRAQRFANGRELAGSLASALGVVIPGPSMLPQPAADAWSPTAHAGIAATADAVPRVPTYAMPGGSADSSAPHPAANGARTVSDRPPPRPSASPSGRPPPPESSPSGIPPTQFAMPAVPMVPGVAPFPRTEPIAIPHLAPPPVFSQVPPQYTPFAGQSAPHPATRWPWMVLVGIGIAVGIALTGLLFHLHDRAQRDRSAARLPSAPIAAPPMYPMGSLQPTHTSVELPPLGHATSGALPIDPPEPPAAVAPSTPLHPSHGTSPSHRSAPPVQHPTGDTHPATAPVAEPTTPSQHSNGSSEYDPERP